MTTATKEPCKFNIKSYAIFDLETNGLPSHNFNKVAITEISIYGISAKNLANENGRNEDTNIEHRSKIPEKPRILHKLNLLFNPQMLIAPDAEKVTGLNNYTLENESPFDKNAANIILNFLDRLQQPVCLIAHNGWNFDFPILKKMLEKVQVQLPARTLCVDSFAAFKKIDTVHALKEFVIPEVKTVEESMGAERALNESILTESVVSEQVEIETEKDDQQKDKLVTNIYEVLESNDKIDWRAINETTPKRSILKRKIIKYNGKNKTKVYRGLFQGTHQSYNPRGFYKLANIYERIFGESFDDAHHAEADVNALTKIIQYYGKDFIDYAETCARPFSEVINVGASWSNF